MNFVKSAVRPLSKRFQQKAGMPAVTISTLETVWSIAKELYVMSGLQGLKQLSLTASVLKLWQDLCAWYYL